MNKVLILALTLQFLTGASFAQIQTYQSSIDQSLSVHRIAVLPMVDNVKGIYAKPLTERLQEVMGQDRRFDLIVLEAQKVTPEDYEAKPKLVAALLAEKKADALLTSRLVKGPQGLSIRLTLIAGSEHLPMVQESLQGYQGFETADVKMQLDHLLGKLFSRLPYQALVTSRQGHTVTLNAGLRHGLKVGDEVYVILISAVERHPKLKFITKVDREIMGKIRISKVDESIAFGGLIAERSANLVQSGFKVAWSDMIQYPGAGLTDNGLVPNMSDRPEAPIAYGDSPREWRTGQDASFGKVSLLAGLGQSSLASSFANGDSASSSNPFSPVIRIDGEMWFDPNWQFDLVIEQLATKLPNGLSGSSPSTLNMQMQELGLLLAYNFLVDPNDFWGPKFQLLGGFSKFSIFVDDSTPRAHSSTEYSGLAFGMGGVFPVTTESRTRFLLGGKFLYYWQPTLSESPTSSGGASNQLIHFNLFLEYGLGPRMAFRTDLNFKQASSSFSGGTANSSSANFTTLLAGGAFYF